MNGTNRSKQIAKNTIALYIRTAITMMISLYITRVVLDTLGKEDYGIYNVVGSIVVTFSFFNTSLQAAIQRFLTFSLGEGNLNKLNNYFSMSIMIVLTFVVIIIFLADTIGLYFLRQELNIPDSRLDSACWAFQFTILTFAVGMMRIPLEALVIAHERMSFFAYLGMLEQGLRLIFVFILCFSCIDKLVLYSFLLSITAIITLVAYYVYCKQKFSYCSFAFFGDRKIFKDIFSFSGWTLWGASASLGTQQALVFLLNIFYGVVANAALGIAQHVVNAVNSFVGGFQTAFRPQIVKSYAQNDQSNLHSIIHSTSKISFLLIFIPGIIIIVNAPYLLQIWLKDVPVYTVSFCRLFLVCCIIDGLTGPYNAAIMASGEIRNYQIVISMVFCIDIICICVMFVLGVGAEYILYSRIATRGLLNMFVGLYFLKVKIMFDVYCYFKMVLMPVAFFLVILIPAIFAMQYFLSEILLLIISVLVVSGLGSLLGYAILLDDREKYILKNIIFAKLHK